jgi:DNA-binding CsgD family transcriptional regulator
MTLNTAVEYAWLAAELNDPAAGMPRLSARERELVTLVAHGHTDAQITGQLHIGIRTVRSHLDCICAKTGCRRRADLTRLALQAGAVWPGRDTSVPVSRSPASRHFGRSCACGVVVPRQAAERKGVLRPLPSAGQLWAP